MGCADAERWNRSLSGLVCASATDDAVKAFFNATASGLPVAGVCLDGYSAAVVSPSRTCLLTGVWSPTTGGCSRT
jgi:hypothetical protein